MDEVSERKIDPKERRMCQNTPLAGEAKNTPERLYGTKGLDDGSIVIQTTSQKVYQQL